MRRLSTVSTAASVAVALVAACSSASEPSAPPPASPSPPPSSKRPADPLPAAVPLLKQSTTSAKNLRSVHLAMSVTGAVAGMPVTTLEGDVTGESRGAAKGNATITVMGAPVGIEFVETSRRLYAALPGSGWRDYGRLGEVWDLTATLSPQAGLANLLSTITDPSAEAREAIDDQQTIRIVGKAAPAAVNKIAPLAATKPIQSTVWVEEGGDHQVVRLDLEPTKDDTVETVFSKWNESVTVDKPR